MLVPDVSDPVIIPAQAAAVFRHSMWERKSLLLSNVSCHLLKNRPVTPLTIRLERKNEGKHGILSK